MLKKLLALIAAMVATSSVSEEPDWETVFNKTDMYSCALWFPIEGWREDEKPVMPGFLDFKEPPGLYLSKPFMGGQETRIPLTYMTSGSSINRNQTLSNYSFVAAADGGVLIVEFETRTDELPTEFFKISFWSKDDSFKAEGLCELPPNGLFN